MSPNTAPSDMDYWAWQNTGSHWQDYVATFTHHQADIADDWISLFACEYIDATLRLPCWIWRDYYDHN